MIEKRRNMSRKITSGTLLEATVPDSYYKLPVLRSSLKLSPTSSRKTRINKIFLSVSAKYLVGTQKLMKTIGENVSSSV